MPKKFVSFIHLVILSAGFKRLGPGTHQSPLFSSDFNSLMRGSIPALAFMTLTTFHLHQKQGYFYKIICIYTNTTIIRTSHFLSLLCTLPVMIPSHELHITVE